MTEFSQDDNAKHPDSTAKTKYPYNQPTITRSGHEFQVNDTPGHESLKYAHTRGTYFEINETGRWTHVIEGKSYIYSKDGSSETVDGHKDIKVGGTFNVQVDGSTNEGVTGDKYISVGGMLTIANKHVRYDHVGDDFNETIVGNHVSEVDKNEHTSIHGDAVRSINGSETEVVGNQWTKTVGDDVELIAGKTFHVKCKEFIVDAESIILRTSSGTVHISGSGVDINGTVINLNNS